MKHFTIPEQEAIDKRCAEIGIPCNLRIWFVRGLKSGRCVLVSKKEIRAIDLPDKKLPLDL